jgi:hypothetical protein
MLVSTPDSLLLTVWADVEALVWSILGDVAVEALRFIPFVVVRDELRLNPSRLVLSYKIMRGVVLGVIYWLK